MARPEDPSLSPFDAFPDEIIEKIVFYLDAPHDLMNTALVGTRFARIVPPYLYHTVSHEMYKKPQKLHSLLRTLFTKPKLASYVKHIALKDRHMCNEYSDSKTWETWAASNYNSILPGSDKVTFLRIGARLHNGVFEVLSSILDDEEAQACLLLILAPHIEELTIENPSREPASPEESWDRLPMKVLQLCCKHEWGFRSLKKFTGVGHDFSGGEGCFKLSSASPLFRLPSLEIFHVSGCTEPDDVSFVPFDCPENSSSVKHIHIQHSAICAAGLTPMIRACKSLESFAVEWAGHVVGWVQVNFPLLRGALDAHHASLTRLVVDARRYWGSWPESDEVLIRPLGSLGEFKSMKYMNVPAHCLIGWDEDIISGYPHLCDILPPNLEELEINKASPHIYDHLRKLADICPQEYPALHRIGVPHTTPEEEAELLAKFNESSPGVELNFKPADDFCEWYTLTDFAVDVVSVEVEGDAGDSS